MAELLLEGEFEDLPGEPQPEVSLRELAEQVNFLANRIAWLGDQITQIKRGLGQAASGAVVASAPATSSSKWDMIKQRLQPRLASAIDVLLVQSPMSTAQLAAAMRMDRSNCGKNVVAVLLRQGLIVRNGHNLSLKQL